MNSPAVSLMLVWFIVLNIKKNQRLHIVTVSQKQNGKWSTYLIIWTKFPPIVKSNRFYYDLLFRRCKMKNTKQQHLHLLQSFVWKTCLWFYSCYYFCCNLCISMLSKIKKMALLVYCCRWWTTKIWDSLLIYLASSYLSWSLHIIMYWLTRSTREIS